jgi:hypothetical protein
MHRDVHVDREVFLGVDGALFNLKQKGSTVGIEGVENLTPNEGVDGEPTKEPEFPDAGRDQELEDKRQAELQAERDEHNRRTAGGDPKPS